MKYNIFITNVWRKKYETKSFTYILFGEEAIDIYNISIVQLLMTKDVNYNIGKFNNVRTLKEEVKKWDDFLEIKKNDYLRIKHHFKKNDLINGIPKKKKSFWKFITGNNK